jgi:pimeloyl-ACP methyl ester carboxylesterase
MFVSKNRPMNKLLTVMATVLGSVAIFLATRGQVFSRVTVNGPSLRMLAAGQGTPTVVFEAGAGGPLEAWCRIQGAVAEFARTISYDRAGNGLSSKGALPRDGRNIATELHAALQSAGVPPPYVLVGHSLGGPYIRVFAGMYPDEVAGMVLVDPTQEDLIAWAKARDPKPENTKKFRPEDEVDCAPLTFNQVRQSQLPTGIPIILIAGMGPRVVPTFLPNALKEEAAKDREDVYRAKLRFYQDWLRNIPNGRLVITEDSGHGIPFEEPQLVIDAVREIVQRTR